MAKFHMILAEEEKRAKQENSDRRSRKENTEKRKRRSLSGEQDTRRPPALKHKSEEHETKTGEEKLSKKLRTTRSVSPSLAKFHKFLAQEEAIAKQENSARCHTEKRKRRSLSGEQDSARPFSPSAPEVARRLPKIPRLSALERETERAQSRSRSLGRVRVLYRERWVSLPTILSEERVELGLRLGPLLRRVTEVVEEPAVGREERRAGRQRELARLEDEGERGDIQHLDWRELREADSDKARKDLARRKFRNPVFSDPAKNISYHGFRRRRHGLPTRDTRDRHAEVVRGRLVPISGGKRKERESLGGPQDSMVIRISDFGRVMRSRFAEIVTGRGNTSQGAIENFVTFLKHHREGQVETANFLAFYAGRKVRLEALHH